MPESKKKNNTFLSKIRITAEEIYQDAVSYLSDQYRRAQSTFTSSSPYGQILKVLSNLFEQNYFYLEDAQVENNPMTATNVESIYGNAVQAGHNPTRAISAIGEIRFKFKPGKESSFSGPYIIINDGTQLKCLNNGLTYTLKLSSDNIKINKNTVDFTNVVIIQGKYATQTVIGTGTKSQSYNINIKNQADHNNVKVFVNGVLWKNMESIYDMVGNNKRSVVVKTGISGGIDIFFGNGYFGEVPQAGALIEVQYIETDGSLGIVDTNPSQVGFQWIDTGVNVSGEDIDLNEFLITDTTIAPNLGADAEDPEFTKVIAPLASKSFALVGPPNYEYFLSRYNTFSYIDAYNTVNDDYLDDDNVTYLFILPDIARKMGGETDYFNLPISEFTLDKVEKNAILRAIKESGQQATSSEVQFVDPEIKKYAINVVLRYFDGYDKDFIFDDIRSKLNDYFLNVKRRDKIPKSDIISLVEGIEGVDSVNVFFVSQENEEAIKKGYYIRKTYKIQPTTPFLQEGEGTKKRFIFFNKVLIQTRIRVKPGEDPNLGLDEFGDITLTHDQLPIIRGGWYDRNGTFYQEYPSKNQPSGLSVYFKEKIDNNLNTRVQTQNRKNLK